MVSFATQTGGDEQDGAKNVRCAVLYNGSSSSETEDGKQNSEVKRTSLQTYGSKQVYVQIKEAYHVQQARH